VNPMTNSLRTQIAEAKVALIKDGWDLVGSIMHDGGATGDFGIMYIKDKDTVFVNFKTAKDILYILSH